MEKASVLVTILAVMVNAEMETLSTQGNSRSPLGTKINQLPTSPKQEVYYQPMQLQPQYQQPQPPQQYFPVQLVQAPFYHNQQQQPQAAMIIIAQPAVVPQPQPQQIIYPSATQQLLNYFNSNPQAKYQLLQNYQQQQQHHQQQPYVAQAQATNAQPAVTYQIMPQPQPQYQVAPVTQLNQVQQSLPHPPSDSTVQPQQISFQAPYQLPNFSNSGFFGPLTGLGSISTLAQLTAQKYLPPFRSPAPIITGLENFTPEQQAQIKAQLNSGGPITPLQSNALTGGNLQLAKAQQQQPQVTAQHTGPQEFNPSEEDKTSSQGQGQVQVQSPSTNYNSGVLYRNQFTKG